MADPGHTHLCLRVTVLDDNARQGLPDRTGLGPRMNNNDRDDH